MGRVKKNTPSISLEDITLGYPGLTVVAGEYLLEACVITLTRAGHKSGKVLLVKGSGKEEIVINWKKKCTAQMQSTWKDQDEATESAAVCLSLLLAFKKTGYTVIERSVKKTGFDYWLGSAEHKKLGPFEKMVRLEVSGIFKGNGREIHNRVKIKLRQTKQSDGTRLPAIVCVVEFSGPNCTFESRI